MKVPAAGAGSRGGSPELVAWLRQLPKDADLERFLDSPGESLMLCRNFCRWLAMFCLVSPAATGPMMSKIFEGTALSVPRVLTARTKRSCKSSVHSTFCFLAARSASVHSLAKVLMLSESLTPELMVHCRLPVGTIVA